MAHKMIMFIEIIKAKSNNYMMDQEDTTMMMMVMIITSTVQVPTNLQQSKETMKTLDNLPW